MNTIQVLGAGVMSSAFAHHQARMGKQVSIMPTAFDADIVAKVESEGKDPRFDVAWPNGLVIDANLIEQPDLVVIGVSSVGIDWAIAQCKHFSNDVPVVLLTKGLMSVDDQLVAVSKYVQDRISQPVYAITGPCIASEMAHSKATFVNLSGYDMQRLDGLAKMLSADSYHVIPCPDIDAACWLAALKNAYAIAIASAGESENEQANALSCAVQELSQWLKTRSMDPAMLLSLSGIGDLYVTTQKGRNGRFGRHMAEGLGAKEILNGVMQGQTIEGLKVMALLGQNKMLEGYPLLDNLAKRVADIA